MFKALCLLASIMLLQSFQIIVRGENIGLELAQKSLDEFKRTWGSNVPGAEKYRVRRVTELKRDGDQYQIKFTVADGFWYDSVKAFCQATYGTDGPYVDFVTCDKLPKRV